MRLPTAVAAASAALPASMIDMPFDFANVKAPFRMQLGLQRIAAGTLQLSPNRLGSAHFAAKLAVLARHADQALMTEPGFDPGPVQTALMTQAVHDHPGAFAWDGAACFAAHRLGWALQGEQPRNEGGPAEIGAVLTALTPPEGLAGLLSLAFEEDFAAIDGDCGRIGWLAVCLPSHWSPAAKIGRSFAEVHAPVADNQALLAASAALVRLVTAGERWQRFVWTITPRADLDAHPERSAAVDWHAEASPEQLVGQAFFRTEQQTFIPVGVAAGSRQAAFTIRVDVEPLVDVVDSGERARQLHAALASMSTAVLGYRGLGDARDRLLTWLASRAE